MNLKSRVDKLEQKAADLGLGSDRCPTCGALLPSMDRFKIYICGRDVTPRCRICDSAVGYDGRSRSVPYRPVAACKSYGIDPSRIGAGEGVTRGPMLDRENYPDHVKFGLGDEMIEVLLEQDDERREKDERLRVSPQDTDGNVLEPAADV